MSSGWKMGKAPRGPRLTGASEWADCSAEKKGQPVGRPVYEWNEAFEYDVYPDFPYRATLAATISGRPSNKFCIDSLFAAIGRMP
jgi:hypothetical protein